jgi:hypothetical protein
MLMAFVLLGVTIGTMAAIVIGLVILAAANRPF